MLSFRTALLLILPLFCGTGFGQEISKKADAQELQHNAWPPKWLEGNWKIDSVEITCAGEPTKKHFSCFTHAIFTSGLWISVTENQYVSASPIIANTTREETLNCLFKVSDEREALRGRISPVPPPSDEPPDTLVFVTYLSSPNLGPGRFRFVRKISRIKDELAFAQMIKKTFQKRIYGPGVVEATKILEKWTSERIDAQQNK